MNDFNSRYRNIDDEPGTIRTNAGGYAGYNGGLDEGHDAGFGSDMDIMEQENIQRQKQAARASKARGTTKGRKSKRQMLIYGIIIAVEVIALIVIWAMYISYNSKLSKGGSSDASAQESSDAVSSGNINVENENFSLTCNKISITADSTGAPVAIIYFNFVNKTDTALSMSQVFSPSFKQTGVDLAVAGALTDAPQELSGKDTPVSGGQAVDCAFAVNLMDTTSEITITMHDNYETFSDIGSTVVPIS